ncbi:MAG: glycosyl transferase family 2 [Flavobacteriaceae bacterium CG_4_8_14_3_um_filter_34_10]|nr:glycosyltransferase family 2 protein [Flavobacteriia bacterium]OIP51957.1 MAG: glycosyl transferase family 2 [Flavobacteriaceae bacterium CG2_30_34_30]PIQ18890.1 MAG: glycosyl transferase family 2 [Flavobacteriaceae bacterium CG18_big_fil_WC_8_21_14_2_50_34_36]PIV49899.1 MAG: glycosyl transferase family 2 [Flavobacteriaceae bacterium CG02_land_8_20_14_3_00_34_13]PIX08322.1 MAG: glycosyl transferase family 2 [Flavobacteriaceae bacterium CG_4_8_14_3_um_filter_34_10]PIZ08442.1 MAG: glycosyl tr
MKFYIVIPAHNEEKFIHKTLDSLVKQTLLPAKIVVVDDHSTDATSAIVTQFTTQYPFITLVKIASSEAHLPGSKVINAFYKGFDSLDANYDVICKFDADLIFPENYLEKVAELFKNNPKCGMAGGFCTIEKNGKWILETLTDKFHIRGALKTYRKKCFQDIGKLKIAMGWDTVDELLAQYHGWEVCAKENLEVKHLKPTGKTYNKQARYKQGEAFYKLRYGFWITCIASLKLAILKKKPFLLIDYLKGYFLAKNNQMPYLVTEVEGVFIRKLRLQKIKNKIFFR